jgi:hypothetical protein
MWHTGFETLLAVAGLMFVVAVVVLLYAGREESR